MAKKLSIIINDRHLRQCREDLKKTSDGGQWLIVPELHDDEEPIDGRKWVYQAGKKMVIIHPIIKGGIGMESHVEKGVPHHHENGIEQYLFHGLTRILVTELKKVDKVETIDLSQGGYVIFYPGDYCHFISVNSGGWDNFYFGSKPYKKGDTVDKVRCSNCLFQGRCELEKVFLKIKAAR